MSPVGIRRPGGLQLEIVASLFVVMLSGLAIVAVVIVGQTARLVEGEALERLRMGARFIERMPGDNHRLADLAPVARAQRPNAVGGVFRVFDDRGRELGLGPPAAAPGDEFARLFEAAQSASEVVERGGIPLGEVILVVRVSRPTGERGFLVGVASREQLMARLVPVLWSSGWVLLIAAVVFVAFGAYLLRGRIVLPLRALSAATRRIAAGDLGAKITTRDSNELGDLARNFNQMAESLAREHAALTQAHESLTRSERLATLGQLAAGVAHEVGNPTAAVLGYAEVALRDGELSERTREMALRIRDEALRIRVLVREMLDLSRSDAVDPVSHRPIALLSKVAERVRAQPLLEGITLEVSSAGDLPEVEVDAHRVDQVLTNLIENAAHAVRGCPDPSIELWARRAHLHHTPTRRSGDLSANTFVTQREPDAVALEVVDNGPGIEPDVLPQIFDPFFTTKEPGEGTGLGLSNAHRLAELLGGRLEAESEPGRTCVRLVLPCADTGDGHVPPPRPHHR